MLLKINFFFPFGLTSQVLTLDVDYSKQDRDKWIVGSSALVRVTLKNGAFHEDIGYGVSKDSDQGAALERAKKAAVTDARRIPSFHFYLLRRCKKTKLFFLR